MDRLLNTMEALLFTFSIFFVSTVCNAQLPPGCGSQVSLLIPCLPFVQGQTRDPTVSCCNSLKGVVNTNPVCLCSLVAAGPGNNTGVNVTLALKLPSRCKLSGVSASACNSNINNGPSAAPVQPQEASPPSFGQPPDSNTGSSPSAQSNTGSSTSVSSPMGPSSDSSGSQTLDVSPQSDVSAALFSYTNGWNVVGLALFGSFLI